MKTIIEVSEITETSLEKVIEQVLALGNRYHIMVEDRDEEVNDAFVSACVEFEEYSSREIQRFTILGELNGDCRRSITIVIYENYVDAGSEEEYVYSFVAFEYHLLRA